jgi:hypothetical protein
LASARKATTGDLDLPYKDKPEKQSLSAATLDDDDEEEGSGSDELVDEDGEEYDVSMASEGEDNEAVEYYNQVKETKRKQKQDRLDDYKRIKAETKP